MRTRTRTQQAISPKVRGKSRNRQNKQNRKPFRFNSSRAIILFSSLSNDIKYKIPGDMDYNPTIKSPICFISSSTSYHNQSFLRKSVYDL